MSRMLDRGLERLTTLLLKMGELAEQTLALSLEGFLDGVDTSNKVKSYSDALEGMSVDVEDRAFQLIAKFQPVASDLRIIKSYIKVAYDLERYGRYAWDISFIHKRLQYSAKCVHQLPLLEIIIEKVMDMVHISVQALKNHDANLAHSLAKIEDEVDKAYFEYLDVTGKSTMKIKDVMTNLLVVRYLERVADHATYLGESIIYIVTGKKVILR